MASCRVSIYRVLFFLICFILDINNCYRVSEKIYDEIQGNLSCFKRLNGTHEIGCTSKFYGNVGVIHIVRNSSDLEWLMEKGPHSPYILAVTPLFFTVDILVSAWKSGKISGVILLKTEDVVPEYFSQDQTCPNRESSLYKDTKFHEYCEKNPWNPHGSSLLYTNWEFPIFLIDDKESLKKINNCYINFNKPDESGNPREWPLCSIELKSNMYATTNSEVCVRRSKRSLLWAEPSFCDPLEDYNVWNSIRPLNMTEEIEENSIILVSTSADASSLFDNRSPGAEAAVSGLVTFLATVESVFRHKEELIESNKNLIFTIFQGESWDYIGSSRMVYDMVRNQFPYSPIKDQVDQMRTVNISHIDSIIDIKQVGLSSNSVFMHTDPLSNLNSQIRDKTLSIMNLMKDISNNKNISFYEANPEAPLPPSSFQSFLKEKNISGIFVSDYRDAFKNKYYQSIFDDYRNIKYNSQNESDYSYDELSSNIAEISNTISSSIYSLMTGTNKNIEANMTHIQNLLYCYLRNVNCSYFRQFSDESLIKTLYSGPAKMFVSVQREENHLPYVTSRIFAYFAGNILRNYNETNCTSNNTEIYSLTYFPYINNGTCIQSTVHYSEALSPAFIIENYDWKSGEYSTWTESGWYNTEARIFLRPSIASEIGLIFAGLFCILISLLGVHFFNSRSEIIFSFDVPPAPC